MTKTTTLLMAAAAIGVIGFGGLALYSAPPADAAASSKIEASEHDVRHVPDHRPYGHEPG